MSLSLSTAESDSELYQLHRGIDDESEMEIGCPGRRPEVRRASPHIQATVMIGSFVTTFAIIVGVAHGFSKQ